MKRQTIGIVDYGVGNLASVRQTLLSIGHRCRASCEREILEQSDVLLLPGVGAFPAAMSALISLGLDQFIRDWARSGGPTIGICLGMQLLADSSSELELTAGLGLIPGSVLPLDNSAWHIGWNSIEVVRDDSPLRGADGLAVYFNHSHVIHTPSEYVSAVARIGAASQPFPVAVERRNVVGLQFHPEKSQGVGRQMMSDIISEVCRA